jgi:hypothetical protein
VIFLTKWYKILYICSARADGERVALQERGALVLSLTLSLGRLTHSHTYTPTTLSLFCIFDKKNQTFVKYWRGARARGHFSTVTATFAQPKFSCKKCAWVGVLLFFYTFTLTVCWLGFKCFWHFSTSSFHRARINLQKCAPSVAFPVYPVQSPPFVLCMLTDFLEYTFK